jgi:hypothetical protein
MSDEGTPRPPIEPAAPVMPPQPGAASWAPEVPAAPPTPPRRSARGWIVVAVVIATVVLASGVVLALTRGGGRQQANASGPRPSSAAQPSSSPPPSERLPAEIDGIPRLVGDEAAALEGIVESTAGGEGIEAVGVYGEGFPDYVYIVLDVSPPAIGLDYRSFLRLAASGAGARLSPGVVSGSRGHTKVLCAGMEGYPMIRAICAVDDGEQLAMVMSYRHPNDQELVDILLAAAA